MKQNYFEFLSIIDKDIEEQYKRKELPILIRENFKIYNDHKFNRNKNAESFCFMVHGLEGSSHDLRNIRSILQYYCPNVMFVLSEENEDDTNDNIEKMGRRLAREIKQFI